MRSVNNRWVKCNKRSGVGWLVHFQNISSGISVSPDVGLVESSGVRKLL